MTADRNGTDGRSDDDVELEIHELVVELTNEDVLSSRVGVDHVLVDVFAAVSTRGVDVVTFEDCFAAGQDVEQVELGSCELRRRLGDVVADENAHLLVESLSNFTGGRCALLWIGAGEQDVARGVDQDARLLGVETGGQGVFESTALFADARDEQGQVGREAADGGDVGGRRSSGHQAAVAVGVPEVVDAPSDGAGQVLSGDDVAQALELRRSFVAGTGQDEEELVGIICQERPQRLVAQVRVEGDAVDTELLEDVTNVAQVGVADVGPLGVQNDRDVGGDLADVLHSCLQYGQSVDAKFEVESQVGLVGRNQILGVVDDGLVEGQLLESRVVVVDPFPQRR